MSSAHVLLSNLQDRSKRSSDSCCATLLELRSFCRYDEVKSEILAHGIDLLLALASDESLSTDADNIEALLELLHALAFDNHSAKVKLAQKGALQMAVGVLDAFTRKKPTKKRNKILKLALEMLDQWSCCIEQSRKPEQQGVAISQILRILDNAAEDASVLLRATDVLRCMLDGKMDNVHTVAKLGGISILLRLLGMSGEKMDVKRSVCEVLLHMGDASEMMQVMASDNAVHALGGCLQVQLPGRAVESVVVRLLMRLSEEAQVYGQMINEDMMHLLFEVVDRNCNVLEVAGPACAILERLSRFARDCKLDLSPYLQAVSCRGSVLISAATCHVHAATLVLSVFGFFVNISYNPVDLPLLINSETIEGLLALYILNGGCGSLSTLSADLVQVVSLLSRSAIESLTLKDADTSLPSIFLCLRNHYDSLRFASQVFAMLTKYWKQQMMEVYNFVREVLLSRDGAEVVRSCGGKILYETLHTPLHAHEQTSSPPLAPPCSIEVDDSSRPVRQDSLSSLSVTSDINKVTIALVRLLDKALAGLPDQAPNSSITSWKLLSRHTRDGDNEYDEYVTKILHKERGCLFKTFDCESLQPSGGRIPTPSSSVKQANETPGKVQSSFAGDFEGNTLKPKITSESDGDISESDGEEEGAERDEAREDECVPSTTTEDAEPENVDDGNDDRSDDEYDDDDVANETDAESFGEENQASIGGDEGISDSKDGAGNGASKPSPPKPFIVRGWSGDLDVSHFEDKEYYFLAPSGAKYPRHPSRRKTGPGTGDEHPGEAITFDEPSAAEPCKVPNPDAMSAFVEQANLQRNLFLKSDPRTRAKLVYESTSCFEDLASTTESGSTLGPAASVAAAPYLYDVPTRSDAFESIRNSLTFDSCFESGNLERAVQIGDCEYDLFLRRDFDTHGHMQWFYFGVSNIRASATTAKYRFNIVNLCKPDSLFNQGLQPVVYSVKDAKLKRTGWRRSGSDIYYFSNPFPRPSKCAAKFPKSNNEGGAGATAQHTAGTYYTLTFTLEFANADDTYLIAHSYPYTLSDHQTHLEKILHHSGCRIRNILRHTVLCTTLSGKHCDLLSISDFSASSQELQARKAVVISSRVHPGETQASWMMRGVIDFLVGESDIARVLRRLFLFQIIPMLNPDGVYYGNSRCGLSACDLNRQWYSPSQKVHPTIFHAKELLKNEFSTRGVVFFCDIHGHSRKKNVFMYGCDTKKRPNPQARAFAKLFSTQHTAKSYISFADCSFKVSKSKETTARVVVANELRLSWCFTLEASFCGGNFGELQGMHYNTRHMHQVGSSMCETLFQACASDGSVRERLVAMVGDYGVSIPGYVETQFRANGIISDASGVDGSRRDSGAATPRKVKARSNGSTRSIDAAAPKLIRRRSSSSKSVKPQKEEQHPVKSKTQPESRNLERKQNQRSRQRLQSTPPADPVDASVSENNNFATAVRAKIRGKMLSDTKKTRRKSLAHETAKCPVDSMPAITPNASYAQDTDSNKLHSIGRGARKSSCPPSAGISTPFAPAKPLAEHSMTATCATSPSICALSAQLAESTKTTPCKPGMPSSPNAHSLGSQSRDTASAILPPPMSELRTRSPKTKSASVRFR